MLPGLPRRRDAPAPAQAWGANPSLPALDPITRVQAGLLGRDDIRLRFPALRVTGMIDGPTTAALVQFQHDAGIPITGVIDRPTELALGVIDGIPGLPTALPEPVIA